MKFSQPATASLALLLQTANLATVNAQTPPNSQPSTETTLIVTYNGSSIVETDMLLFPDRTSYTHQTNPTPTTTNTSPQKQKSQPAPPSPSPPESKAHT